MIADFSSLSVYLAPGVTDMRKPIDGLSLIISEVLTLNPFSENLFVFCNRKRNKLRDPPLADQRLLAVLPQAGEKPFLLAPRG